MRLRVLFGLLLSLAFLVGCGSSDNSSSNKPKGKVTLNSDVQPFTKFAKPVIKMTGTVTPPDSEVTVNGVTAVVENGRWTSRVQLSGLGEQNVSITGRKAGYTPGTVETRVIRARTKTELVQLRARRARKQAKARLAAEKRKAAAAARQERAAQGVSVPDEVGERLDVAEGDIRDAGLTYKEVGGGTFGIVVKSNWTVCETRPGSGTSVSKGTRVKLIVDREC